MLPMSMCQRLNEAARRHHSSGGCFDSQCRDQLVVVVNCDVNVKLETSSELVVLFCLVFPEFIPLIS
jgi:hypothetical protein